MKYPTAWPCGTASQFQLWVNWRGFPSVCVAPEGARHVLMAKSSDSITTSIPVTCAMRLRPG